ncbi:MAG: hypothetical protein ACLFNQ_05310 [Spirochaetaceae bacterium]
MNKHQAKDNTFEAILGAPFERLEKIAGACIEDRYDHMIEQLEALEIELDLFVRTAGSREPSTFRHRMPTIYRRRSCEQ